MCRRATDFGTQRSAKQTQQMLIPESAKSPAWMQFRQEIEDILIQKRVAHFDRRMHGDAVAFGLEEMAGQKNARGNPDSAMERVPSFGAFQRKILVRSTDSSVPSTSRIASL